MMIKFSTCRSSFFVHYHPQGEHSMHCHCVSLEVSTQYSKGWSGRFKSPSAKIVFLLLAKSRPVKKLGRWKPYIPTVVGTSQFLYVAALVTSCWAWNTCGCNIILSEIWSYLANPPWKFFTDFVYIVLTSVLVSLNLFFPSLPRELFIAFTVTRTGSQLEAKTDECASGTRISLPSVILTSLGLPKDTKVLWFS